MVDDSTASNTDNNNDGEPKPKYQTCSVSNLNKKFFVLCLVLVRWRNLTAFLCETIISELNLNRCGDGGSIKLNGDAISAESSESVDAWKKRRIIRSDFEPGGKARFDDITRENRIKSLRVFQWSRQTRC
jgi:hypothetical protein